MVEGAAPEHVVLWATLALLLLLRVLELALDRANRRRLAREGATVHRPDAYGLILFVHVGFLVAWPLESLFAPWAATGWWLWPLLILFLAAQAVRYWCIVCLGYRWSVRVITLPGAPLVRKGPYRFLRHPNYVAVYVELVSLALAFGAFGTAVVVGLLNFVALRRRIRIEETALAAGPKS